PVRRDGRPGGHRVDQERRAGDLVQDFRQVGIHPRALSGGKNDERCGHECAFLERRPVLTKAPWAGKRVRINHPYGRLQSRLCTGSLPHAHGDLRSGRYPRRYLGRSRRGGERLLPRPWPRRPARPGRRCFDRLPWRTRDAAPRLFAAGHPRRGRGGPRVRAASRLLRGGHRPRDRALPRRRPGGGGAAAGRLRHRDLHQQARTAGRDPARPARRAPPLRLARGRRHAARPQARPRALPRLGRPRGRGRLEGHADRRHGGRPPDGRSRRRAGGTRHLRARGARGGAPFPRGASRTVRRPAGTRPADAGGRMSDRAEAETFTGSFTQQEPLPEAAIAAALRVMHHGRLHRYNTAEGEIAETALLEEEFAAVTGAKYCLAVASGGYALGCALKALGIGPGDRVLTNAFTLAPVPDAIAALGATPVFVEATEVRTIHMADPAATSPGAEAPPLSHMRGHTCDMDRLMAVCDAAGLPVVEDCAHTMGAAWKGVPSGRHGVMGCYSTQTYKHMNSGEGGLIVSDDADLMARAILLSGSYM